MRKCYNFDGPMCKFLKVKFDERNNKLSTSVPKEKLFVLSLFTCTKTLHSNFKIRLQIISNSVVLTRDLASQILQSCKLQENILFNYRSSFNSTVFIYLTLSVNFFTNNSGRISTEPETMLLFFQIRNSKKSYLNNRSLSNESQTFFHIKTSQSVKFDFQIQLMHHDSKFSGLYQM